MAIVLTGKKAELRDAMTDHVMTNISLMNRWHKAITVDRETMSPQAVRTIASSNLRAAAAASILSELEYQPTADRIEYTLGHKIVHEMSATGSQEALAVYVEAHLILTGENELIDC